MAWTLICIGVGLACGLALAGYGLLTTGYTDYSTTPDDCSATLAKQAEQRGLWLPTDEIRAECEDRLTDPFSEQGLYSIAYQVCERDPIGTYGQSQTSTPEAAARWFAFNLAGKRAILGYDGCLDALSGAPNRY